MLLSLTWRFVFISNMKAASTSIEHALSDYAELQRIHPRNSKHFSLGQITEAFPGVFGSRGMGVDQFVKFGVIREPRDWLCSWFNYRSRDELSDSSHGQHDQYVGHLSFDEFAQEVVVKRPGPFGYVRPQSSILATDGVPDCDYIVRFERFDEDMDQLLVLLGMPVTWADIGLRQNRTASPRLRSSDVDWGAYPELESFLEPDVTLRRRYLDALPSQADRVVHLRQGFEPPSAAQSLDASTTAMLRSHWQSYAASVMYGPTLGVSPERAEAEVAERGIDAFFPSGVDA